MNQIELKKSALAIRKRLLQMHFEAKSSHLGTGLSEVDLLTFIFGKYLNTSDRFVLSKGHGASGLYATLHHFGRITDEQLSTYYKDGTKLAAHPSPLALPDIPIATGSLGHGLSVACGLAYAMKVKNETGRKVTCLLSDGECNEGSTWEAALFAGHHQFSHLTVVVDLNGLQGFGFTKDVLNLEPMVDKWQAFGFQTVRIDGHDFQAMEKVLLETKRDHRPLCIIAQTVKGKGISFMENKLEWHYLNMNEELYKKAMSELEVQ